jgi:hypothetical protein
MIAQGFKCPAVPKWTGDDWAVLNLENPIEDVTPYDLPELNGRRKPEDKVVSVNAYNDDFFLKDRRTGEKRFPKTIEDCTSKIGHYEPVEIHSFESTCDVGGGASGGSILKIDSNTLIAIHKGNDDGKTEVAAARIGHSVRRPYQEIKWASYQVLVRGEFLATLRQAIGVTERSN